MTQTASLELLEATTRKSGYLVFAGTLAAVIGLVFATVQANREATRAAQQLQIANDASRKAERAADAAIAAKVEVEEAEKKIAGLRDALGASRLAIEAFHQRDYPKALTYYDVALRADPDNAYLLNLRAYALFKDKRYEEALMAQEQSLRADPTYAWGYFDLARFQCALGRRNDAQQATAKALKIRPELRSTIRDDGEFRRLCGNLAP